MLWVDLILFFQPDRNKKRKKTGEVTYERFSGAEMPMSFVTYLIETLWMNVEVSSVPLLIS